MTQDNFDTQFNSYCEEVSEETTNKRIKIAAVVGGSAIAGATAATVIEEYDKSQSIEAKAEEIAANQMKELEDNKQVESSKELISDSHTEERTQHIIEHHYETRTIVREVVHETPPDAMVDNQRVDVDNTPDNSSTNLSDDVKVEVIAVHHDVNVEGHNIDVAVVDINDDRTLFVDVNQDGMTDAFIADINENGNIENEEIIDIREHQIPMPEQPELTFPMSNSSEDMPSEIPDYSSDEDITLYDI